MDVNREEHVQVCLRGLSYPAPRLCIAKSVEILTASMFAPHLVCFSAFDSAYTSCEMESDQERSYAAIGLLDYWKTEFMKVSHFPFHSGVSVSCALSCCCAGSRPFVGSSSFLVVVSHF